MKHFTFLFGLTLFILGVDQRMSTKYLIMPAPRVSAIIDTTDTSSIAILPFSSSSLGIDSAISITITSDEVILIDSILKAFLNEYNEKGHSNQLKPIYSDNNPIRLENYCRQYIPYSLHAERIVFINCFAKSQISEFRYWRKYLVSVDGGGKSFFSAKVNLTLKKCFKFWVNAPL
ncbi:MAG TPA: hypothetical protein PKC54_14240 [Ferruginibacter sp.]|nr:hypothetical protein [Ferruginibacter sp.]